MPLSFKCILCSTLTLATLASAQSPQPSQSANLQSRSPEPTQPTTIRTKAKLVIVDVTVSDKNGDPLHNLKKEDFTVLENGTAQTVNAFEEHVALSAGDAVKFPPLPQMPPGVFTNITPAPVNSAVNILLIDSLNTSTEDQPYLRSQLTNYINHASPGTSIAIFSLTTTLNMLQGFTSDPEILKRIVAKQVGQTSPLLARNQTGDTTADIEAGMVTGSAAIAIAALQNFQASTVNTQLNLRSNLTLAAFNILARYLSNIPGRKNLVWFSGSFPLDLLPNNAIAGNGADSYAGSNSEPQFRQTVNLLARGHVAVYPVDCRGVIAPPSTQAQYVGNIPTNGDPSTFNNDKASFEHNLAAEHSTMERLASSTGGRAFINTNDLAKATADAIEIGSNYYTLSYTPANGDWKGEFRKIEVKLNQKGYTLAYRHGYYADDPNSPQNVLAAASAPAASKTTSKAPTPDNGRLVRAAMMHGAPGSTEILYKVRVLPTAEPEDLVAPGNVLSPFGLKKAAGRFRRYVVDFDADAKDMLFPPHPGGGFDCKVEFVIQVYQNVDGQLVDTASDALVATLSLAQRNKLIRGGFPFHQEVSVPLNGSYSLRIGVHDFNSDHIGVVEVPVASLKDLAPVAAVPAAAKSNTPAGPAKN